MRNRQDFHTKDRLRLEVGRRPYPAGHASRNVLKNPNGVLGAWGWLTPSVDTRLVGGAADQLAGAGFFLESAGAGTDPWIAVSEATPATPGSYWQASFRLTQATTVGMGVRLQVQWLDTNGATIGQGGAYDFGSGQAVNSRPATTAALAPAGTAYAQVRIDLLWLTTGPARVLWFDRVMFSQTSSGAAAPAYQEPYAYTDVLGSAHRIVVDRAGLNLGTLSADIADSALDPADSDLIRPGNPVRLLAATAEDAGVFLPIYTGEILNGTVRYQLLDKRETKRARIVLSAVDATKPLANQKQDAGVGSVHELQYLMEGAGVPWSIDNSTEHNYGAAVVRSRNENASVLDQIASTRDTVHGYAWVSRFGVLHANGPLTMSQDTAIAFTEDDYAPDIDVDFDTARVINEVTVKMLSLDAEGKTVETVYPVVRDETSIREWGRYYSEFTVQATQSSAAGQAADAATFANAVLAANATPTRAVRSLSFKVKDSAGYPGDFRTGYVDPGEYIYHRRVFLDLYDRVTVSNSRAGLVAAPSYVASLRHEITATSWSVTVGFDAVGGVAAPTAAPELPVQAKAVYPPGTILGRWNGWLAAATNLPNNGVAYTTHYFSSGPLVPEGARQALISVDLSARCEALAAAFWTYRARLVGGSAGDIGLLESGRVHNSAQPALNIGATATGMIDTTNQAGRELEVYINGTNDVGSAAWIAVGVANVAVTWIA